MRREGGGGGGREREAEVGRGGGGGRGRGGGPGGGGVQARSHHSSRNPAYGLIITVFKKRLIAENRKEKSTNELGEIEDFRNLLSSNLFRCVYIIYYICNFKVYI